MKLSTQSYKGTRDFYPEDMRLRKWMLKKMRDVCEAYGYEEYDGPVLEPIEIYASKTSEEIVNEQSFNFTDRGGRKVIMRPEMTPTVSRMVAARRQELGYPLRLYSIPNFFRYERPQKGRLREFWQLNADIFGVDGIEADIEIIKLADSIMKAFGAKEESYEILISSRAYNEKKFDELNLTDEQRRTVISALDKFKKVGAPEFEKLIKEKIEEQKAVDLLAYLKSTTIPQDCNNLINNLKKNGIIAKYDKYIARGFDYYTDIVFEVFDTNDENNRSLFGGGRYDGLVAEFGVEPVPTVGFGMGDVTLENFLKSNNLIPLEVSKPTTDIVLIGDGVENEKLNKIAEELRASKLNVAVDYTDRKFDKKLKAAEKLGLNRALVVRTEDIDENKYFIINPKTKEKTQKYSLAEIAKLAAK